ncbi:MAG: hypothetical protein Q9201_003227 [Fulgogasparrea decipioides]
MSKPSAIVVAVLLCWSNFTSGAVVEKSTDLTQPSTTNDKFGITCDGSKYGFNVDPNDCLTGLDRFIRRRDVIRFAERDSPQRTEDMIPLPWRWMGGKPSCYIQPVLKPGVRVASGDNNLALILGRYEPGEGAVQCAGRNKVIDGFRDILYRMPTSKQNQLFGPKSDPKADVDIPWTITTREYGHQGDRLVHVKRMR